MARRQSTVPKPWKRFERQQVFRFARFLRIPHQQQSHDRWYTVLRQMGHGEVVDMEYEVERNRSWQLASLLITAALVGGALAFALAS